MIHHFEEEKVQEFNFSEPENDGNEQIEKNFDNMLENPDENLKKIIKNIFYELNIEISEELSSKTIRIYNEIGLKDHNNGIDILRIIFEETARFSNFNINKRLIDFFDFLLSIENFKLKYITNAIKKKVSDLDKNNQLDILYFWKVSIIKNYLQFKGIKIEAENSKKILKLLIEHNYNISQIYNILDVFKLEINNDNSKINNNDLNNNNINNNYSTQYDIIKSFIDIIISYPKAKLDDLINYLKSNLRNNKNQGNKSFDSKIALDFYLKASSDEYNKDNSSPDLTIPELLNRLKILNPNISDNVIRKIDNQLKIINSIVNNPLYENYTKIEFKEWTNKIFPKLKNDSQNIDLNIATILGMISLAIKKETKFCLRNTQLIAVLMFIGKDKRYGLIEEISTGEGKSCIICSLSIYYALRGHKVDILSSGYTLAKRDSNNFKKIYDYFNLTTAYPYDAEPGPYKCDILYGTFLDFEGDYLREITSGKKIRNNRKYDVIIIDEVDNLFIDNILGSTRLTNSAKGFKYLIPMYLSTYISLELFDFFFLIFFKISLQLADEKKKKEI